MIGALLGARDRLAPQIDRLLQGRSFLFDVGSNA
jgi:hypothetical protein